MLQEKLQVRKEVRVGLILFILEHAILPIMADIWYNPSCDKHKRKNNAPKVDRKYCWDLTIYWAVCNSFRDKSFGVIDICISDYESDLS